MHLRAGVGHDEIRNASVIPPPEDEERLDDDAGDRTRAPNLFRLTRGRGKSARIPIAPPFFQNAEFTQGEINGGEDKSDDQECGQGEPGDASERMPELRKGLSVCARAKHDRRNNARNEQEDECDLDCGPVEREERSDR